MRGPSYTGRTLGGRYAVEELLGEGGWGAVYAATQTDLGRKVALKILHVDVALTTEAVSRFEREAKTAASFGHPNIVQVTDFQNNPNEPQFLVMERLTGATLGSILERQVVLPQQRVAAIAYQMLSALDVAHRAGLVHRDVKPDNVFLVSMPGIEDFVKLLDFGIAKLSAENIAQLTGDGQMLGSPAFMSPEQVRSQAIDHRADIYAVGATMYFALAGRLPFDATNIASLLAAIMDQKPKPLASVAPNIDPRLAVIVERALHKDPFGRFESAADMRAALEPFVQAGSALGVTPATLESVPNHLAVGLLPKGMITTGGGPPASSMVTSARPPAQQQPSAFSSPQQTGLMGTPGPSGYGAAAPMSPPMGSPPPGTPPPGGMMPYQPTPYVAGGGPMTPMSPNGYSAVGPTPNPYGPTPAPATTPEKKSGSSGLMIGIMIAILALVLIGVVGGLGAVYYFAKKEPATVAAASSASGAPVSVSSGAAPATPTSVASGAATPASANTPGAMKTKPNPPPGPNPTAPDAGGGGNRVTTVDAGTTRPQMAGSTVRISGGTFEKYDIEKSKTAVGMVQPQLNACYAATEFDPPNHEFTCWTLTIDPNGNVTNAKRSTDHEPHAKLDPCVSAAFRMSKWQALPSGGTPQVCLAARRRDNP